MTSDEPKVLIQRGDLLYCEECRFAWPVDDPQHERHDAKCKWYRKPMTMDEEIKEGIRNIGMGSVGASLGAARIKDDSVGHATDAFREPSHVPERIRKVNEAPLAQAVPVMTGVSAGVKGWVCARCQRVYAPHVSECPHCQPIPGVQHGS